jgi:hypothetical protein
LSHFGIPIQPAYVIAPVTNFQWTPEDTAASTAKCFNDAVETFKDHPSIAYTVLQHLFCNKLPKCFHVIVCVSAAFTKVQTTNLGHLPVAAE